MRSPMRAAARRNDRCSPSAEAAESTDLRPPLDWISSDSEEIAVDTAPNGVPGGRSDGPTGEAQGTTRGTGGVTQTGTARVKRGMAEMLKGGVIMDVVTPEQARIAEAAGAVAVMALE